MTDPAVFILGPFCSRFSCLSVKLDPGAVEKNKMEPTLMLMVKTKLLCTIGDVIARL